MLLEGGEVVERHGAGDERRFERAGNVKRGRHRAR